MALAGGGGGGAAAASVGAPSVGGWGPGGGGSSYHSVPSGGLLQPHLRQQQQQQQQQQQAELDRKASSVFPSAADPQQLLRCDTLASGMVPLRASHLGCGEGVVDASAGGAAEHQRSVENLLKLQALQEVEGRWQERERRWQAELGEERTRTADLTLRLQAAADWRAKLEERVREDSQRILSCDRSEQRALDACQLAAQAAAAKAEADKAAADELRRENGALQAEAAALRGEVERLRSDGDTLRAENAELRKRPERVEPQPQPPPPPPPPPPPQQQQQAQPQPGGLSERERGRLGALVRELRGELSAVEARRRSDKQGFQSGAAALQAELSALRALSAEQAREAEQTRSAARRLREREGDAAALRVRLEEAEAARDAALRDKRELQASAAAAAAAATAAVAAASASAKGEEDERLSSAAAAAAAAPFSFGDEAARVRELEEQVAVLKKAKRAVVQEREEWKYRALLAAPASVNCMHCGRLVTVWPGEPAAEQGLASVPVSTGQQGKRTPPPPEGAAGACSLYDSNECPHRCPRHPNAFA